MTEHELSPTDWVRKQTEQILAQGTTDGVQILDRPVVLFTTTGAKSGKKRLVPLMRVEHNGRYALVASKGGAPEHPSWYHNVKANPLVEVERGTERFQARATIAEEPERTRLFDQMVAERPGFGDYQRKTTRVLPVIVLERVG